jgi:hypothetical protein
VGVLNSLTVLDLNSSSDLTSSTSCLATSIPLVSSTFDSPSYLGIV